MLATDFLSAAGPARCRRGNHFRHNPSRGFTIDELERESKPSRGRDHVCAGPAPTSCDVALAAIATAIPPLLLSFGIWQAWWQSALWIVAALMIAIHRESKSDFTVQTNAPISPSERFPGSRHGTGLS